MKTLDFSKLDLNGSKQVVNSLQQLLADYQVFYTNLRGFHWDVKGRDFFVMHAQFESLYNNAAEKVDEIAERILMLDGVPVHNFSEYLKLSQVKESPLVSNGVDGIKHVLETYSHFVSAERNILKTASEYGDEATVAMMSDYIKEQEKMMWMLTAFLS